MMHIYTLPFRWGFGNVNTVGAKFNFYRIQTKFIASQVFIHRLQITELGGFWNKVYYDPGMMGSSLPLLLYRGLSFALTADRNRCLSLR